MTVGDRTLLQFGVRNWSDPGGYSIVVLPYPNGTSVGWDVRSCDASSGAPGLSLQRSGTTCGVSSDARGVLGGVPEVVYVAVWTHAFRNVTPAPAGRATTISGFWPLRTGLTVEPRDFIPRPQGSQASRGDRLNFTASVRFPPDNPIDPTNVIALGYLDWTPTAYDREGLGVVGFKPDHVWAANGVLHTSWNLTAEGIPDHLVWVEYNAIFLAPNGTAGELAGGTSPTNLR